MSDEHENSDFKLKTYWDDRFTKEESYEWLVDFKQVCPFIFKDDIDKNSHILIVGCGNSQFSADLYDFGYKNIVNIDFSEVCINNMILKNKVTRPEMQWLCMDMTNLEFNENTFDIVIDKASMDALMVDEGDPWDPCSESIQSANNMCQGISKILKPNGKFIQITFSQPHFRTKYLMAQHILQDDCSPFDTLTGPCNHYQWTLSYENVNPQIGCINYFIYTMIKFPNLPLNSI